MPTENENAVTPVDQSELEAAHAAHAQWLHDNTNRKPADLSGRFFVNDCDFSRYNFAKAIFRKSNLENVNLNFAKLHKADLTGAYLRDTALTGTDLSCATFDSANLSGANFHSPHSAKPLNIKGCSFQGADLTNASLAGLNLTGCDFRHAALVNADLTDVRGLLAENLAGADVTLCKLPEKIGDFDFLDHVNDAIHNAKVLFHAILAFCGVCVLVTALLWVRLDDLGSTIAKEEASTLGKDENVQKAAAAVSNINLPGFTGIVFPTSVFLLVVPFALVLMAGYFLVYMTQAWQRFSELPAIFPDGRPVYKRVSPWLLNHLFCPFIPRLSRDESHRSEAFESLALAIAWIPVPATLTFILVTLVWHHRTWPHWAGIGSVVLALVVFLTFGGRIYFDLFRSIHRVPAPQK